MTTLSQLVDGASGDVPVATLLRQVKVLAFRGNIDQLDVWVEHELQGYPPDAQLPSYRGPFQMEVQGHFGGPFNTGYQNAPIPSLGFPERFRDGPLFHHEFRQPIAELADLGEGDGPLKAYWPADWIALTNQMIQKGDVRLYEGMGLQQAWRLFSPSHLRALVDTVRTRILDLALSLERVSPDVGEPDAPPVPAAGVQNVINHVYGGTSNWAIASTNVDQRIGDVTQGDREGLFAALRSLGVSDAQLNELGEALDGDGDQLVAGTLGPRTRSWLGQVVAEFVTMGAGLTTGVGAELIAIVLAQYLGLSASG